MVSAAATLRYLGARSLNIATRFGQMGVFLCVALAQMFRPPYRLQPALKQLNFIGARSVVVISVAGLCVGMVVALQFYDTLVRFGSVGLLGTAVGMSLIRELGPVLTALMVIARAGSAVCAELAIMRAENQIDALDCMAVDPYAYLVVPRFLAMLVAVPLLTALFDVIGIAGGWFVGVVLFGVSEGAYFEGMAAAVTGADVLMGVVKPFVFGLLIIWICGAKGFLLHLQPAGLMGAEGVSRVTTEAVVLSSIAVLYFDFLISALML